VSEPGQGTRYTVGMPSVEAGMEVGRVMQYLVELGTEVTSGQPLFIAEGDKVTMEIEAPVAGRVIEFCVPPEAEVARGAPVLILDVSAGAKL
jgi:pyruvate/2-oxoglutarate dehydrogenase complex dihydrolipoamide acyltransferase (E2) component